MKIKVNKDWLAKCGMSTDDDTFEVIKVRDFGSRGKFYVVQRPYDTWEVWDIRGVEVLDG